MADIAGSYNSNQSYNPKFVYKISYSQTGRSGSAVSYKFNVSFTKTNGWYGYDIIINWNIGGATGSKQIKSTSDLSSGSTSFDVTCSTNAAGGTLSAQIWTTSSSDSTHWQNAMNTGSQTVTKSTFNTAPSLSGSVSANGAANNHIIPENQGSISVTWPAATDANNNLSGYRLRVSINGGGYTELTRTTSRSYSHNVSNYGEGATFQYAVDAYDSYSTWSGTIYSGVVTKNKFTASTITSSSSISYSDANSSISFTVSGGSNTNGSAIKSRTLTCSGITVYNGSVSTGTVTVTVFRSGTTPTGPYIKFDDIKNKLASSSYTGSLNFTLTTTNNYSNSKSNSKSINVDLRTNPNAVGSCAIATTASTAYKQVGSTGNYYYIPDTGNYIRVTWTAGSGKLGEGITYDIYVSYGGGSWQLVKSGLSSSTLAYNHSVPKQNESRSIRYKIRAKTSYGYYSDRDTSLSTLHYYNSPGISTGAITRGATTADVIVTIKSVTSIPNLNTVGSWVCYNKGTTTPVVSSGTLTVTQNAQTLKLTGLTDSGQYDLKVTYNDNTGFSSNKTQTIAIGANWPIFFVNKYGVGVNGIKADATYSLKVSGAINVWQPNDTAPDSLRGLTTANMRTAGITNSPGQYYMIQNIGAGNAPAQLSWYYGGTNVLKFRAMNSNNSTWGDWANIYTTLNKPTPADIGAMASGGTYNTVTLNNWVRTTGATGWYNETYGGGWNMSDTTWIRSYGAKQVYIEKLLRTDGGFQVGASGGAFNVTTGGTVTAAGAISAGGDIKLSKSPSSYSRLGYDASSTDTFIANGINNWLRLKTDMSMTYAGHQVYTGKNFGSIPIVGTRITNLNTRLASGWYAWSSNATGRPADYGVLLVIQWGSASDYCQLAISTGNAMWTRWYVNGAWTSWVAH